MFPNIKDNDWNRLRQALQKLKSNLLGPDSVPTFSGLTLTGLTASRLIATDASSNLSSVSDLTSWIAGTANRVTVSDDGDGSITLSSPQDIHTAASPTFANLSLGTGELTCGSINRAADTLTLEIGGTAELSISSSSSIFGGNIVIPDTGYIGSVSDTDSMQIAADGSIIFTQDITSYGDIGTTGNVKLTDDATVGIAGGPTLVFDQTDGAIETTTDIVSTGEITALRLISTSGTNNAIVGYQSDSYENTTGNAIVGTQAGYLLNGAGGYPLGQYNVLLGYRAGYGDTTAVDNTGYFNNFIGAYSGLDCTTGAYNIGNGYSTLANITSGSYNISIGVEALTNLSSGARNVAIGFQANVANTTANENIAIGYRALATSTVGNNLAIGYNAAQAANTTTGIVALGWGSQYLTTGNNNLSMGYASAYNVTTGSGNVYLGGFSGYGATAGTPNTGIENVGIGFNTLYKNTDGQRNFAMGSYAMYTNTGGDNNIAIGYSALRYSSSADRSIAIGSGALYSTTIGDNNLAIGHNCCLSNTTGERNACIGLETNYYNQTGSYNTCIGAQSGRNTSLHSKSSCVMIGYQAGYYETGSNKLFIDNANRTSEANARVTALVYGIFNAAVASQSLLVNGELKSSYGAKFGDGGITNYTQFGTNGDLSFQGSAGFYPVRIAQAAQPSPDTGELVIWRDTDDGKVYLVYNDTDSGVKQVEMV